MKYRALSHTLTLALLTIICTFILSCKDFHNTPTRSSTAPAVRGAPDAQGKCTLHAVPFEVCTRCNPALVPVFKAKGDWCDEHDFPMSFCPIHNPNAIVPGQEKSTNTSAPKPHVLKTSEEADDKNSKKDERPSIGQIEGRVVRFASPSIEKDVGITTVKARKTKRSPEVSCAARLTFNADRVADVRALVPGIVREVRVKIGQHVKKGDTLFVLASTRVSNIQSNLQSARERVRLARAHLARQQKLHKQQISSLRAVEIAKEQLATAEAIKRAARANLNITGAARGAASGRYNVTAPLSGQVTQRPVAIGSLAATNVSLATIVDTSSMWVLCDVPEQNAHLIANKQVLSFEMQGVGRFSGVVNWVSPSVDPRIRTIRVRAEIKNPDGHLRANQFATATLYTGTPHQSVVVPRDAIQRIEGHDVVFVRASAGTYLPRVVEKFGDGKEVSVRGNINVGEEVVTQGAVLLRTEAMPGSIGAGCCEVEPRGTK